MGLADDLKARWNSGSVLLRLIFVNVAVFLILVLAGAVQFLLQSPLDVVRYLGVPSDLLSLAMQPWTVITYMFTHEGFWHLFWNMLILYFLGRFFLDLLGAERMMGVYLLGGIAGAVMYVVSFNVFPAFVDRVDSSWMIGASASVMAVVFGVAAYTPNYQFSLFLPRFVVKLWWIAAFYLITDIIAIQGNNPGGALAHIGGALFGIVFANRLKKGSDLASGLGRWVLNIRKARKRRSRLRVAKKPSATARKATAPADDGKQAKVDHILDKISKSGYDSLSEAERDFLFRASKDE